MHHSIKTQRKNDKLLNDGKLYVYHFLSESGEVKYWRCEYFNTVGVKCKGRLHTDVNDNILKTVGEHICNISPARIEAQRIVTGIKRRAVDTMEGPSTIRAQVLQNVPTPVLSAIPNKYATKKIIKRARNEIRAPPAAPVELRQLQIPYEYQTYSRSNEDEEQFLLADSGVNRKIVDADYAQFIAGHTPAPKKLKYRDADARILRLVQLYVPFNNGNGNGDHQYAMQNQNPQRIIDFLTGISKNYHMKKLTQ